MARKGNLQNNGKKRGSEVGPIPNAKGRRKASEVKVFPGEELPNGNPPGRPSTESVSKVHHAGTDTKHRQNSEKSSTTEKHGDEAEDLGQSVFSWYNSEVCIEDAPSEEASSRREPNEISPDRNVNVEHKKGVWGSLLNGFLLKDSMDGVEFSYNNMVLRNVRASAVSTLKVITQWLERQRPIFNSLTTKMYIARDCVKVKIERFCPVVLRWLMHFGNVMLLLSIVWLDCTLRGLDSFLRMGTTSLFSVIWCSTFSMIAMVGMMKFLMVLVSAGSISSLLFRGFHVEDFLNYKLHKNVSMWRIS